MKGDEYVWEREVVYAGTKPEWDRLGDRRGDTRGGGGGELIMERYDSVELEPRSRNALLSFWRLQERRTGSTITY